MAGDRHTKDTDDEARFRCAGGIGILREETWVDTSGNVVRYNLAFLLPHRFQPDNGRVLGYDNAHGIHERHLRGVVKPYAYKNYAATVARFSREVRQLRRDYEDENLR